MMDTTTIDYSLWAVELARDEFTDCAYQFHRTNQQVQTLQTERRRLVEQGQQKGAATNGTQR